MVEGQWALHKYGTATTRPGDLPFSDNPVLYAVRNHAVPFGF